MTVKTILGAALALSAFSLAGVASGQSQPSQPAPKRMPWDPKGQQQQPQTPQPVPVPRVPALQQPPTQPNLDALGLGTNASPQAIEMARKAHGAQPGTVQQLNEKEKQLFVLLNPYEKQAGVATLEVPASVPIFRDGQPAPQEPRAALKAGTAVNVFYQRRDNQPPLVVGIDLLSAQHAEQLKQQTQQAGGSAEALGLSPNASPQALEMARNAHGAQPGTVQQLTDQAQKLQLTLTPFEKEAGVATLEVPASVPIFRDGQPASQDPRATLKAGTAVNVFYQRRDNQPPLVVGIDLLSEQHAEQIKQQMRQRVGGSGVR